MQFANKFELKRKLGGSRLGMVHLAVWHHQGHRRVVALRTSERSLWDVPHLRRVAESSTRTSRGHANVVSFLHLQLEEQRALFVSEFCSGKAPEQRRAESLAEWLSGPAGRSRTTEDALGIIRGVLEGLCHLHRGGVCHGALNPGNVLLRPDGAPALINFGFTPCLVPGAVAPDEDDLPYLAPEARRAPGTPASDVYALGAVLYLLLTGRPYVSAGWKGYSPTQTDLPPDVPGRLHTVLRHCLAERPQDRYPSVVELREEYKHLTFAASLAAPDRLLNDYLGVLLRQCGSLDLIQGSAESATARLELQDLFVALRVHVETPRANRDPETDSDSFDLQDLETRRLRQRIRSASREVPNEPAEPEHGCWLGDAMRCHRHLVVLGDPGSGKTTLLRWLALAYLPFVRQRPGFGDRPEVGALPVEDCLPILIRCRDLSPPALQGGAGELLQHAARSTGWPSDRVDRLRGLLREGLERGVALLLIDGLDEIADLEARARFYRLLVAIRQQFSAARLVVTSRIVGYRALGNQLAGEFEHAVIAELSRQDRELFVHRWCQLTERPERAEAAAREFLAEVCSQGLERLAGNPMLLTTLALVKRRFGRLPKRRAGLFEEAVQVLLSWRGEGVEPLDNYEALPQLQYLAHEMCSRGVQHLSQPEILAVLERVRNEHPHLRAVRRRAPEEFLRLLVGRTAMLDEVGEEWQDGVPVPVYEFRHLSFQEYLAGQGLARGCYRRDSTGERLEERVGRLAGLIEAGPRQGEVIAGSWREALRACVACCDDDRVDGVLLAILGPPQGVSEGERRGRAVLAAECLADDPNVADETAQAVLSRLVDEVHDQDGRAGLERTVRDLAGSEYRGLLLRLLLGAFLRREGSRRKAPGLLFARLRNGWPARAAAHECLRECVDGLAAGGEKATQAALRLVDLARVKQPSDLHNAARAGRGLGPVVKGLLNLLGEGGAAAHAAGWALYWLRGGTGQAGAWEPQPDELSELLNAASAANCDKTALFYAFRIFQKHGYTPALPTLVRRLKDADEQVHQMASRALRAIGKSAGEPLLSLLKRGDLDEIDLRLVSVNFNGQAPWLDPRSLSRKSRILQAVKEMNLPFDEVRRRWQRIAKQFDLP